MIVSNILLLLLLHKNIIIVVLIYIIIIHSFVSFTLNIVTGTSGAGVGLFTK